MPKNDPPKDLDIDTLTRFVAKLARGYSAIQRITLHELDVELPRYLISVEVENFLTKKPKGGFTDPVPADEIRALREKGEMAKAEEGKRDNFRRVKPEYAALFDVVNDWQPDRFPALIGERFEEIYRPEYVHKLQRLQELEEHKLRNGSNQDRGTIEVRKWNAADEWMIELHEPGAAITEVFEGECWLLYQRADLKSTKGVLLGKKGGAPGRKPIGRWENAIARAERLIELNPEITIQDIAYDDEFSECFDGRNPAIDTIRKRLNEHGIRLKSGARPSS